VLTLGSVWEGSDVRVWAVSRQWYGVGQGSGRLHRCRVTLAASHRPNLKLDLWLPGDDGRVQPTVAAGEHRPPTDRLARAG
jgi:hypothetical protein